MFTICFVIPNFKNYSNFLKKYLCFYRICRRFKKCYKLKKYSSFSDMLGKLKMIFALKDTFSKFLLYVQNMFPFSKIVNKLKNIILYKTFMLLRNVCEFQQMFRSKFLFMLKSSK